MNLLLRIAAWCLIWILVTCGYVMVLVIESAFQADPSAIAWFGFLPLLLPVLFAKTAWVWVLAIWCEILMLMRERNEE